MTFIRRPLLRLAGYLLPTLCLAGCAPVTPVQAVASLFTTVPGFVAELGTLVFCGLLWRRFAADVDRHFSDTNRRGGKGMFALTGRWGYYFLALILVLMLAPFVLVALLGGCVALAFVLKAIFPGLPF